MCILTIWKQATISSEIGGDSSMQRPVWGLLSGYNKKKDDLAALSVRISPKCFVFLNSPSKSYSVISTLSTPRSHYPYENCLYTFYHKKVGFWKCTHLNCLFLRKVAPLFRWRGCLSCCSATPGRPPGSCWRPYWTYLRGYIVTWLLDNLVTWLRSFFVK